jgi:threonine dehydrogenase-like Zn-dependent dehydrogenase
VRPGGTIALLASYWDPVPFPQFFTMKEPVLVGANMHGRDASGTDMEAAAHVLADLPEVPAAMITHRFPLDRANEAFAVAADRAAGAIKVVLEP